MGGFLGKVIIKQLENEGKENLVDSFVMIGVPQLGTPQAAAALLHGDDEGIVAGLVVRPAEARSIAQNMPSAYDLLPSPRYFDEVLSPVITFSSSTSFTQEWRDFWGLFINTYPSFLQFATGDGVVRAEPPEDLLRVPEVLRPDLMADAADFHNEYDDYAFPEHIRVVQVAGWGRPTTKEIEYIESHGLSSYKTIPTREGDKTVVYPSAVSSIVDETYFFDLFKHNQILGSNTQHRDLLNTSQIQNLMESVIEEGNITQTEFLSSTKPPVANLDDQLIVSTHSPVVLGAYDEFGNFTGIDPTQDLSADILFITEDIPGSTFLYSSDSQHIFLPKDGMYSFIYKGIGEGPTTVEIQDFIGDEAMPIAAFSNIPTTQNTSASFTIDGAFPEETTIEVDEDGDGEPDETVSPDGSELSLNELLALLIEKIQGLDIENKLKKELLKKIEKLEKKIEKKKEENAKTLAKLEKEITKQEAKGKLDTADADELLAFLEELEAQAEHIVLDADLLATLKDKIESLDVKKNLKKDLLKRVEKLENQQALTKALSNLSKKIVKKGEKGNIDDVDAQELINLLEQIESAI